MKVILKTDVAKQGKKGQVIEVADGYGRNFLIKRGFAIEATKKSLELLSQQKDQANQEEVVKGEDAVKVKEDIENLTLTFKVKSNNGLMFGSISSKQITEELQTKSVKIDKRKIVSGCPINELGMAVVRIEVYPKVFADLKVLVESE
jgi:large subunit ribosomal protein L9